MDFRSGLTIENLQAAYEGESNANARYLAFAESATEDGYHKAAALFKAAAAAEAIHAAEHAKVIRKMGAEPRAVIKKPEVKSMLENLQAALDGETFEMNVMYPEFIKIAEEDGNKEALRTFRWAMKAEVEHAGLYAQALKDLENWKTSDTTFFVCKRCGYTTTDAALARCPVCAASKEEFIEIR